MARKTKPSKLRLTNKKTGRLSSSSTWLLDLAATAVIQEQHSGIPSLLPQLKARKLLVHNELKPHKEQNKNRTTQGQPTKLDFRRLAREASNTLKMYYIEQLPDNKKPASVNNKGFRVLNCTEN